MRSDYFNINKYSKITLLKFYFIALHLKRLYNFLIIIKKHQGQESTKMYKK